MSKKVLLAGESWMSYTCLLYTSITGLRKVEKGCVILGGTEITNFSPKKSREAGLAHIPEDRNTRGLNRTMTCLLYTSRCV